MPSITEKVQARAALKQFIDEQTQRLKELDLEIIHDMRELEVKEVYAPDGGGYSMTASVTYKWPPESYRLLEAYGLSDHFRSKPTITKGGLEQLFKDGVISSKEYGELMGQVIATEGTCSLRRVSERSAV